MSGTLESVEITAGTGTKVAVDQVNQSAINYEVQVVKIGLGEDGIVNDYLSGSTALAVDSYKTTVSLYGVYLWTANTEYSLSIPNPCRRLSLHARSVSSTVRFAFATGRVAGGNDPFQTLNPGSAYDSGDIRLPGGTLYLAVTSGSTVAEVEVWA